MTTQQRSLYRRHRPRTFDDVVGQEPVVRTLRNAVELDRVHHAYLFVGSRGTGKTSLAKILAACLNCEQGRTTTPCGVCASCVSIAEARSLDVIEMDAASHNSVEDVRELRESVAFQPLSGRKKVYILDEAHMLSNAAWNAFLKTLEEPPSDTVFVMATTEAQKVPATVIDRCHRFDFQRPTVEQVARVVSRTAEAESISIPPEAIAALARSANGSFRDALGTLEQIVTYGGETVALEDVLAVLGVADTELVEQTLNALAASDAREALLSVERCVQGGRDVAALASELEARARELLLVQVLGDVPRELSLTEEHDERLREQALRVDQALLTRLMDLLGFATQVAKAGGDARTQLELALLKAASPEVDPSTKALLARIERLEAGGGPSRTPPATTPLPKAPTTRGAPKAAPTVNDTNGASAANDVSSANDADVPSAVAKGASAPSQAPASNGMPPVVAAPSPVEPTPPGEVAPPAEATSQAMKATPRVEASPPVDAAPPPVEAPPLEAPPAEAPPVEAVPPPAPAEGVDALAEMWPAVVDLVRQGNALLGAVIAEARPFALDDGELTVAFPPSSSFNKRKAESASNKESLSAAISTLTGQRLRLAYELREDLAGAAEGEGGEEDLVRRIIVEFDAEELPEGWAPEHSETQEGQ
ncbi:MAG TPA: DNA polymerase III subunit gamma/tau [Solirubrobacteraceae bacterium]|jgi:DNA polymerase-3 subunit gamma/tau